LPHKRFSRDPDGIVFSIGNCDKTCDDADDDDDSDEYDSNMVNDNDCDGNDDRALNTNGTDYDSVSDDEDSKYSGNGTVNVTTKQHKKSKWIVRRSKRLAGRTAGYNEYDWDDDNDVDDDCDGNDNNAKNTKGTDYDSVSDDEDSEYSGEGTVNRHSKQLARQSGDDGDGTNEYDSKKDDDNGDRNDDTADIGVVTTGPVIRTAYCK
jgi:hypothetical protein